MSREDFKAFLREVRRQNKNTLSGLSLDTIAQQVKDIIEVKELKKRGNNAVTAKGKAPGGKGRSESRPVENKGRPVDSKGRPLTENKARPDSRPVDKKKVHVTDFIEPMMFEVGVVNASWLPNGCLADSVCTGKLINHPSESVLSKVVL